MSENQFLTLVRSQLARDLRSLPSALRRGGTARRLERAITIADVRELARAAVPRAVFDFVDGAAGDEVTARRNRRDFDRLALVPRTLVDVERVDLSCTVLGLPSAAPLIGAPTGLSGLVHHRGEAGLARAMHAVGCPYTVSAMASYSIEEVAAAAPGPTWFQLYMWRDRGLVRELVQRARDAGCEALVVTVDVPRAGARERDPRNGFGVPPRLTLRSLAEGLRRPRWSARFVTRPRMTVANAADHGGGPGDAATLTQYINEQFDPRTTWADLERLRASWDGPLAVKGIVHPADARLAVERGADAVIVSNHGGRQLDHAPSSIAALPAVVQELDGDAEVLLDGGIRRGADVVKALALGAHACLVGRPLLYGLGAGGDAGARHAIELLVAELRLAMTLLGVTDVRSLDATVIASAGDLEPV